MSTYPIISIIGSILWMSLIYYLSSLPGTSTGPDTLMLKVVGKAAHFIIFGMLSIFYLFSFKWKKPLKDTGIRVFIISLLAVIIYAASDEYHQSFSEGRYAKTADVLLDSFGALVFLGVTYKFSRKKSDFFTHESGAETP